MRGNRKVKTDVGNENITVDTVSKHVPLALFRTVYIPS